MKRCKSPSSANKQYNAATGTPDYSMAPPRDSHQQPKRLKFSTSNQVNSEPEFQKLDQSNPSHAKKIQQRRRDVQMGLNTGGYDEYIKQVPKDKRVPRSMKTPTTPDHTLEIPNKRWLGMVRAW
jgi:hypothetical protein